MWGLSWTWSMLTSGQTTTAKSKPISQFLLFCRDGAEFECIYAAYCYEVNEQAKLGGMASSVAKINSVGLRLALKVFGSLNIFVLNLLLRSCALKQLCLPSPSLSSRGPTCLAKSSSPPATSLLALRLSSAKELLSPTSRSSSSFSKFFLGFTFSEFAWICIEIKTWGVHFLSQLFAHAVTCKIGH